MHSIKSNVQSGQVKLRTHLSPRELSEVFLSERDLIKIANLNLFA